MNEFKSWLEQLESELDGAGNVNPKVFIKKHISSLRYLYLHEETVEDVVLFYVNDLISNKKQEYVERLKSKRETVSHSDSIMYDGKILKRCPKGTTRSGNSCATIRPKAENSYGYKTEDLSGLARRQIERLSKAKTSKDVHQAYNINRNRDRKNSKAS